MSGIFAASALRALSHGPALSSAAKKPLPRCHSGSMRSMVSKQLEIHSYFKLKTLHVVQYHVISCDNIIVREPKNYPNISQLLCIAWCSYQHWSTGPKLSSSSFSSIRRPIGSTSHRNNRNHYYTDITTPSVSCIITPTYTNSITKILSHHPYHT